ncbi:hypothetical protein BDZ89DRAFT_1074005 [Hymenopellis radicata]|nr:hypothetical protein BDZ89DRAFT_1074005 [Hymenopellis radicata]
MAKDTGNKKSGKQAHTFRVNPSVPAPHPQPATTGSFNAIQSDGTLDIARIMSNDNPNAPELGPNTLAFYQQRMAMFPHQSPYTNLRYAPYPMPAARTPHGQATPATPFYLYPSSMAPTDPTAPQYPRPSSVPIMTRTPHEKATSSTPTHYYPPLMPTANPPAPLSSRPSRIPTMNPYPDSAATTPESTTDKEDDVHSPPAPAAVQISPAAEPIHSAPVSPEPVNDKEIDAPPAKVEKKKFLTIPGCGWLRGVPTDVYVRTELASDKFVPATLDEEEEKAFDDFLNPDMIEN